MLLPLAAHARPTTALALLATAAVVSALAACGGPSDDGGDADTDATPVDDYTIAPHDGFPTLPSQGGPVLAHPEVVTITFGDDPDRAAREAYGAWIVNSNWLTTVGAEYGVGAGTSLPPVELVANAPSIVVATDVDRIIASAISDGTIPTPPNDNTLYMLYFPAHSRFMSDLGQSCVDLGGYHAEGMGGGYRYAAIFTCPPSFSGQSADVGWQIASSHELIEAATDPYPDTMPGFQFGTGDFNPWGYPGGEVADMCNFGSAFTTEDGHTVCRVWSNAGVMAGTDPCLPTVAPWFGVMGSPGGLQNVRPGQVLHIALTGYASERVDDWHLVAASIAGFHPGLSLDTTTINNGGTAMLTVTVPPAVMSGDFSVIHVASVHGLATDDGRDFPFALGVQ